MRKATCFRLDPELIDLLRKEKELTGVEKTFIINEALKRYFGLSQNKIYLDLPPETLQKLREKAISSGEIVNQIANRLITKGLE